VTIEDLAKTIAAGFRAMKNELRSQRAAIEQTQEAVVQYSRHVEERQALHGERIQRLEEESRRKADH
jgi:hypothetical protein